MSVLRIIFHGVLVLVVVGLSIIGCGSREARQSSISG